MQPRRFALIGHKHSLTDLIDFPEAVEDAIGSILVDSTSIDFTYTDATPAITATVKPEFIQDTVGAMLTDSATVDFTYTDGGVDVGTLTAATIPAGILAQLLTVDGSGSGLDADLLDGLNSTAFALASTLTEDVQDIVGAFLVDSTTIDFTYSDGGNSITVAVIPGGVNHDALLNFVANKHIDHTAVTLTAGAGLTGGGDISASRSFAVGAGTGITVNADDVALSAATITSLGLADTAVQPARTLTAGAGLTGGGTLAADRTFDVGAGTGITVNANDIQIATTYQGANPSATIGLAAVNGTATTTMRSDAAPALSQAIAPTWTENHIWTDNDKVILGTGSDLSIYHDGTNNFLRSDNGEIRVNFAGTDYVKFSSGTYALLSTDASNGTKPRVLVKNTSNGNAALPVFEVLNDADNGLQFIVGGSGHSTLANIGTIQMAAGVLRVKTVGANAMEFYTDSTLRATISTTSVAVAIPITTKGYTVATLPAGVTGMLAHVTDALTPTFGATAVGGGAVKLPVFYNGTNWVTI